VYTEMYIDIVRRQRDNA